MNEILESLKLGKAIVIDVRTYAEYVGGHVVGSLNIPLNELPDCIQELRDKEHIVLCCASGARSASATALLHQHGIKCANGGSWLDVNASHRSAL